jgi:DNA invertase Pin-like site-specific DNA recombinase
LPKRADSAKNFKKIFVPILTTADEGITGTSAEKRPEFLRMIKDCEAGKIDLIITKSISRFARNTLECLTYVRHLQDIGVNILFENNHIHTGTAFSEMILTVLAAFAQEESRSISENTKWGIRKRYENGIVRWCKIYGYTKNETVSYVIVPEEAAVVRKIFELYEHGMSILQISKFLEEQKIPSSAGKPVWTTSAIQRILRNEKYAGDILLQKFLTADYISHKTVRNECTEVPAYYIENHHAPIVSKDVFRRVQTILDLRTQGNCTGRKESRCVQYPLGTGLRCPYCGGVLHQRYLRVQGATGRGLCCESGCKKFVIRSEVVEKALLNAYDWLDNDLIEEEIRASQSEKVRKAAQLTLAVKKAHPTFQRVDYYWLDDLIEHIEIGAHTALSRKNDRLTANGRSHADDCTITVFWKCGLKTVVSSGIDRARDMPQSIAQRFWAQQEMQQRNARKNAPNPAD